VDSPVLIIFVDTGSSRLSLIQRVDADGIIWAGVEDYQRFGVIVTDAGVP